MLQHPLTTLLFIALSSQVLTSFYLFSWKNLFLMKQQVEILNVELPAELKIA
jgi:hypothetical protein